MFFLTFLAQPPGSWLYSFVLLAALEAPATLALQQQPALRRQPKTRQSSVMARLTLAACVLFLVRGIVLLVSLLVPTTHRRRSRFCPAGPGGGGLYRAGADLGAGLPAPNTRADLAMSG